MDFIKAFKIFLLLGISVSSFGQVIILDSYYFLLDDIEDETVEELLQSVRKAVKKYDKFADLIDENTLSVSQEAIEQFKDLFANNAKVYNDISRYSVSVNHADYASLVNDYLNEEGVAFDIYGAKIDGISYDSTGYYEVDVLTQKYLYNGLDEDRKPFYCKGGRTFNLRFTYVIPENRLAEAKILKIQGNVYSECEDKAFLISVWTKNGISKMNYSSSMFLNNQLPNLSIEKPIVWSSSLGFEFQKAFNKKNSLFWTGGIGYSYHKLKNKWSGIYTYEDIDNEGFEYTKIVQLNGGKEKGNVHVGEVSLGMKIRLLDKTPIYVFLHPRLVGHIALGGRFNFNGYKFTSDYYNPNEIILNEFNNNLINLDPFSHKSTLDKGRFFYSGGLELSIQYTLTKNTALDVGIDYQRNITPILKSNQSMTNYFPDQLNIDNISFTNNFYDSVSFQNVGLKIGLTFKR